MQGQKLQVHIAENKEDFPFRSLHQVLQLTA